MTIHRAREVTRMFRTLMVVALLTVSVVPSEARACCQASPFFIWPFDGMEVTPDSVILVYYNDKWMLDPLEPMVGNGLRAEAVAEDGTLVTYTPTHAPLGNDELVTFAPDAPLEPNTSYEIHFYDGEESLDGPVLWDHIPTIFVTEATTVPPPLPTFELTYLGLGLRVCDPSGSSTDVGETTLVIEISGDEASKEAVILIQVHEADGTLAAEMLFRRDEYPEEGNTLGSYLCKPLFEPDPDKSYCLRTAVLDHQGVPGPFSEPSCSDAKGIWQLVNVQFELSEEFRTKYTDERCPQLDQLSEADLERLFGPDDAEPSGCTAGVTSPTLPALPALLLLVLTSLILGGLRGRDHTRSHEH